MYDKQGEAGQWYVHSPTLCKGLLSLLQFLIFIRTHCFKGVYFPVKAFNTSWPTIPPREAARGEKHPCDVNAKWQSSFSSKLSA